MASQSILICESQADKRPCIKGGGWYFQGCPLPSITHTCTGISYIHTLAHPREESSHKLWCSLASTNLTCTVHSAVLHVPGTWENFDFASLCGLETQRPRHILEPHPVPQTLPPAVSEASRKLWLKSQVMHQSALISLGQLLGCVGGS